MIRKGGKEERGEVDNRKRGKEEMRKGGYEERRKGGKKKKRKSLIRNKFLGGGRVAQLYPSREKEH